jgi:mono/diheme cytochrome c family protein
MRKSLALLFVVVLLIVACGPQPLPEEPTPIPTLPPATLPVSEATEPPAQTGPAPTEGDGGGLVEAGQQVFQQNCAACHNLTAEAKVGPGLAGIFQKETLPNGSTMNEENLGEWILQGGGAMPPVPLNDDQLDQVIAFLKEATQ